MLSPEDLVRRQYQEKEAEDFGDSILGGRSMVEGSAEETRDLVPFGANNLTVLRATKLYADAIENGLDGDDVLCFALGVKSSTYVNFQPVLAASTRDCVGCVLVYPAYHIT